MAGLDRLALFVGFAGVPFGLAFIACGAGDWVGVCGCLGFAALVCCVLMGAEASAYGGLTMGVGGFAVAVLLHYAAMPDLNVLAVIAFLLGVIFFLAGIGKILHVPYRRKESGHIVDELICSGD